MGIKSRVIRLGIVAGWNPSWPDPRGVRVTAKNCNDIALWVSGIAGSKTQVMSEPNKDGVADNHRVKIFTDRGNRIRVARVGDVVVKNGFQKFTVIKKADFLGFEK